MLQLLIEAGLWTTWVGLQGIGFLLLYSHNRQSVYAGTGVVGLLAMVLETITVFQIWNAIEDLAFALIGISSTVLYLVMAGYGITLVRENDSLGRANGARLPEAVRDGAARAGHGAARADHRGVRSSAGGAGAGQ